MKKAFVLLFVATAAFGCAKKDSGDDTPKENYITKTLDIAGQDTSTTSFEYNKLNQLSKVFIDQDNWTKLEYYSTGLLAIVNTYYDFPTSPQLKVREYLVLTYDTDRKLRSGVLKRYSNSILTDVTNITYRLNDAGQVVEFTTDNPEVPGELIGYDDRGNVARIESGDFVQTFTHGAKKSCFVNVGLKYYVGVAYLPVDLFNKNDIAKHVEAWGGVSEEEREYATEYTSDDTPSTANIKILTPHGAGAEKRVFEYEMK